MSSLWTPGGEVPIDRQPSSPTEPAAPGPETGPTAGPAGPPDEEELRRQLLDAPVAAVVAQHAVAFYELAAMHLSEEEPRLSEARLAIDALTALLEGLSGRLGDTEAALTEALPRLKLAFVEASDRQGRSVD